jgi:hypothetical protein
MITELREAFEPSGVLVANQCAYGRIKSPNFLTSNGIGPESFSFDANLILELRTSLFQAQVTSSGTVQLVVQRVQLFLETFDFRENAKTILFASVYFYNNVIMVFEQKVVVGYLDCALSLKFSSSGRFNRLYNLVSAVIFAFSRFVITRRRPPIKFSESPRRWTTCLRRTQSIVQQQ